MTDQSYNIQPLFAEPLFRMDLSHAISPEQVAFIKDLKMLPNQTNQISEELYLFDRPELASIKTAVHDALDTYARDVMGLTGPKLYVTQSWSLLNMPGVGMHGHSHSNSIVSGSLYFTDLPEPASRMIFDRHRTYQQIQLKPEDARNNIYNAPLHAIVPKAGELLLFSSSLQHLVEPNPAATPRHSIAFNSFIKGTLGDFRNVSELKL